MASGLPYGVRQSSRRSRGKDIVISSPSGTRSAATQRRIRFSGVEEEEQEEVTGRKLLQDMASNPSCVKGVNPASNAQLPRDFELQILSLWHFGQPNPDSKRELICVVVVVVV